MRCEHSQASTVEKASVQVPAIRFEGVGRLGLYGSFPKQGEPKYRPQNTIILIMGTPKELP